MLPASARPAATPRPILRFLSSVLASLNDDVADGVGCERVDVALFEVSGVA